MARSFVFHDPSGKRWERFVRALQVGGIILTGVLVLVALAVISSPRLPDLGLPSVEHVASAAEVPSIIRGERAAVNVPFKYEKPVRYVHSTSPVLHQKTAASGATGQPVVFGYYVNWDPSSAVSLRLNLNHLTHLVPEWLTLANSKGDLNDDTDPTIVRIATDAKLPILAMVTNFRNGWQSGDLHHVLNNRGARADLIQNIFDNLAEHKFKGVNIDFEQLAKKDREAMVVFMTDLRAKLQTGGYLLSQSVPADDEAYDLKRLGEINDYMVVMVYDEHYQSGVPGPVASQDWFDDQLERLAKIAPLNKTIIGFGNYGYDWKLGSRGGVEVSFDDVIASAKSNNAKIVWDKDTKNPMLRYHAKSGDHEVWFLDAVTALNHATSVNDRGFRGVGLWRLGGEDPGLWTVFAPGKWPDLTFPASSLFPMNAQKSVSHYGEGEVLRVVDTPRTGKRNVWAESDDNFAEEYQELPSYYVVEHTGSNDEKVLTLTFDDGPDAKYTPEILDILKAKKVPATFFVVGVNVEQNPSLIRREYQEGHLIGNHTYSHPNVALISAERMRLELSATLRLIEHATGRATSLFRPPYNADSEPQTPEEIEPLRRAQELKYVMIGERIDPRDWQPNVTPDAIISEVVTEKEQGHIVLLHDGGGDRTATVAALPRLIDTLRSQGYKFIPLSELMEKSRDELMLVPPPDEARWAEIEGQALDTQSNFKRLIGFLFLGAIFLTLFRSLIYGTLAVLQKIRARRRAAANFRPAVSVIIAAYNEEKVIARTVQSVLTNGYDNLEVIVIDDGSKDKTLAVMRESFGAEPRVRILTQANAGKSAALNYGITEAKNEILVAIDADTIFGKGTIASLVGHFSDPKVGAVSGNARVGNRNNWLTRFQSIEYICGFNLDRRALDLLNAITVVPGAVGAWRKTLILDVGGFGHDTLAEDTDLTLSIRRKGYRILYEENAIAYTEAPETTQALAKQRFRWAFGTLQAAWKHRDVTFDPRYGALGLVALPSIWIFQVLLAALSPFAEISMLLALWAGNGRIVLLYYLGFFLLELCTALLAYGLEGEAPWDLALLFFQRIYFRGLMNYVLFKSLTFAIRGRLVGWGKLERTATVKA